MKTKRIVVTAAAAALVVAGLALPTSASAAGTGTLNVQLVTPAGAPLAVSGVHVAVYTKTTGVTISTGHPTNSSGVAQFTEPSGKRLRVDVFADSTYVGSTRSGVTVAAGATKTLRMKDPLGGTISGTVTANGSALTGANVALLDHSGRAHYIEATSAGAYSLGGIRSGTYYVQFNSRAFGYSLGAAHDYTWSYWTGATHPSSTRWSAAKKIVIAQQGVHSAATSKSGISGTVTSGVTLTGNVNYWSPASSHSDQIVDVVSATRADSYVTELNSSGELSTTLNPGKYRVAIVGDEDDIFDVTPVYWWRGNVVGPTPHEGKATWITVTANLTITFNKNQLLE